jgi:hypothetical protein
MAQVYNLKIKPGGYEFNFSAASGEFNVVVDRLKTIVPPELRDYDPDKRTWFVSNRFEYVLRKLFRNFESSLDAIKSQLSMF